MNIIEKVLSFDNHWTHPEAEWTVSQLTGSSSYQRYLHSIKTPKTHKNDLGLQVASQVGNGFHMRAEESLQDEDVITEHSMFCEISGSRVSGTVDVIYSNGLETIVGDFKTKGTYQMKKALKGDVQSTIEQLSIYGYMYSKETKTDMPTRGEIYLIHVGDAGYFSKADCIELGLPEKSKVPKYKTLTVDLLTEQEVEDLVFEKVQIITDEECPNWLCSYCEFSCERRKE